jgi:aminoglycoside phosphotransferase (APT) family kinase protein
MEYLGTGWENWKQTMLEGRLDPSLAAAAGGLLGTIHAHSANDPAIAAAFRPIEIFEQLRIEPYLLATGQRHPPLRAAFEAEGARLRSQREVLTHGDFSPKNILVGGGRLVILDCEAAWYGDAAFDVAFLLNHLFLKSEAVPDAGGRWPAMIEAAWSAYLACRFTAGHAAGREGLERNVARLLPMLMLARIDGKSPVEYLTEEQRGRVRACSAGMVAQAPSSLADLAARWLARRNG